MLFRSIADDHRERLQLAADLSEIFDELGVMDVCSAVSVIKRLKRVDDAAKQLVSTMGATT